MCSAQRFARRVESCSPFIRSCGHRTSRPQKRPTQLASPVGCRKHMNLLTEKLIRNRIRMLPFAPSFAFRRLLAAGSFCGAVLSAGQQPGQLPLLQGHRKPFRNPTSGSLLRKVSVVRRIHGRAYEPAARRTAQCRLGNSAREPGRVWSNLEGLRTALWYAAHGYSDKQRNRGIERRSARGGSQIHSCACRKLVRPPDPPRPHFNLRRISPGGSRRLSYSRSRQRWQ